MKEGAWESGSAVDPRARFYFYFFLLLLITSKSIILFKLNLFTLFFGHLFIYFLLF
jgi:hypothetical protein